MQPCEQKEQIAFLMKQTERQNRALFGNPDDPNDMGMAELVKEIHATQLEMIPTYKDITDWGMFFKKGRQLGAIAVAFALGCGVIIRSIYAIKEWLKK